VRRAALRLSAALLPLAAAACNLAPTDVRPAVDVPAAYKEAQGWKTAGPSDAPPPLAWWTSFNDPRLDRLEDKVASANQDLQAAIARFDIARAEARIARADLLPTVGSEASASRNTLSRVVGNTLPTQTYSNYEAGLDLQYELDLWGRVRNTARAGKARAQASADDLAAVDLRLHAELAADYFTLRADDAQQAILDQTVAAYAKAVQLTQARLNGGFAAEPELSAAEAQYRLAETQAHDIGLQRAELEHAIALLIGEPAARFSLEVAPLDTQPPAVSAELPSALLERRPDIAAAERRAAAANAEIGVARAAYFPTINLAGIFGVQSASTARLFTTPAEAWTVGPQAALILFDGGRRRGVSDAAKAAHAEAAATYRQTVLLAFSQVEDSLAQIRQLDLELQSQAQGVAAAKRSNAQAGRLFGGGLSNYYDVVTTQNIALAAQLTQAQIAGRRMVATVSLIRALGGGWPAETTAASEPSTGGQAGE
jgi:outer membrane protein, multidrug efflux system